MFFNYYYFLFFLMCFILTQVTTVLLPIFIKILNTRQDILHQGLIISLQTTK